MIEVLISLKVNPAVYDISSYTSAAVEDGWEDEPENGVWYLAQHIADTFDTYGCRLEVVA